MKNPLPAQVNSETPHAAPLGSVVGDLRLHEFASRIFRNTRMLRVWLPPGYDDAQQQDRHYPVLYLNDGQNLFDAATSFIGVEWQADETADRLIRAGVIAPMIIVGIDNARKDRIREYLPFRSFNPPILRPQGRHYPDFLTKEVMPFICRQYRIAAGPENTGLGGSSLGAIATLYTVMARPGVFGHLLLESPSLWMSNRALLRQGREIARWPQRVFLAVGTREMGREDKDRQTVDDVRDLAQVLRRAGLDETRLRLLIDEGAPHSETSWARRFPEALTFLFSQ